MEEKIKSIKIPKGTIIKVDGVPLRLLKSLDVQYDENSNFCVIADTVLSNDYFTRANRDEDMRLFDEEEE